jgi:hypothetical protein
VVASNENDTEQSIEQDQTADDAVGCGECSSEGGSDQSQTAENNNTTNQNATPIAETSQSNLIGPDQASAWAPIEWKGSASHRGGDDAEQSNEAETTVIAVNENDTEQTIDQDQSVGDRDGCGKCGSSGGGDSQTQTAENNNTTNQNAAPSASTNQSNEIGSDQAPPWYPTTKKGYESSRGNDEAEQSNEADSTVVAVNENGSEQTIDQGQTADHKDEGDRDHKDKDDDRDHRAGGHKDRGHKDRGNESCPGADCERCIRTQSQTARNQNSTNQNAEPSARTNQSNTSQGGSAESNGAGTKALAANRNDAGQSIAQAQHLSS